jgi:hypothetical protein
MKGGGSAHSGAAGAAGSSGRGAWAAGPSEPMDRDALLSFMDLGDDRGDMDGENASLPAEKLADADEAARVRALEDDNDEGDMAL